MGFSKSEIFGLGRPKSSECRYIQVYPPKKPLKAKFRRLSDENGFFWLRFAGAAVVV
jgi:hypothetical protein